MPLALDQFHDLYTVKGGGTPIADDAAGARPLTLLGSGTAPRAASYLGRRGAEFRSSAFSATSPRCFATDSPGTLNASLYVSSKIQSFSLWGWVKPQKTGISSTALTPLFGLFSATNMGATPWVFDQPCLVTTGGLAGASYVVVSIFGTLLDTRTATQTSGPTSTTPLADNDFSLIVVRVTGSASVNNQADAVELIVRTRDGITRVYSLGGHKAAAAFVLGGTKPTDGKTVTVGAQTYTFRTALAGTPATGSLTVTNVPVAGDTVTIGDVVYTWRASVSPAAKATATIGVNNVDCVASTPTATITINGYVIKVGFGTKNARGQAAGYLQGNKGGNAATDRQDNGYTVHGAVHGSFDSNDAVFIQPASPTSGLDSGHGWADRGFVTKYDVYSNEPAPNVVTLEALVAGVAGNGITLVLSDATPVFTISGANFTGGLDAPTARSVKIGANQAACAANLIAAVNAAAGSGSTYSADITSANTKVSAATGGGAVVNLTSLLAGSAGNGIALSQTGTALSLTAFSGGVDGATADEVLIGGTEQACWQNLCDAINLTGTPGLQYGDPTTLNASIAAEIATGLLTVRAKSSGTAGNALAVSTNATGVVVRDEFRDKTKTTLCGGQSAPPFSVPSGARPDNSDVRLILGGWPP